MSLQGLLIPTWVGCLGGFFFVQRPWGHLTFKSWLRSPILFWTIFLVIPQVCVVHDLAVSDVASFAPSGSTNNPIFRYIHSGVLACTCLTVLAFRYHFIRYAKPLAKLLNRLSRIEIVRKEEASQYWRKTWILAHITTTLSLIVITVSTVLFNLGVVKTIVDSGRGWLSWMGNFVYVLHAVVYFGAMSTRYVALAIIIAVTLNLGMIYRDICDIVEKRLLDISSRDENGSKILLAQGCDMLKRFEQFKWCAEEAEEILGPFVLVTMLASGWMLVTGVHNTLAGSYTGGLSFLVMGEQLIYISLIFLGQYIANMMKLRRKRLQRILTLKPYIRSTSGGKLAHLLIAFNWRLTASNVFDVNRQLLSGIVSNWMNYVVVIFQFQMAMQPKSCVPA